MWRGFGIRIPPTVNCQSDGRFTGEEMFPENSADTVWISGPENSVSILWRYRINGVVTTKMIQYFQKPRTWSLSSDASMWVPVCVCHFSWSDSRYICGIQFSHSEQSLEKCLDFAPGLKASYLKHHMWKNPSYTLYFIQLLWCKTWSRCREAVMGCRSVLWKEKIKKKLNWIWASAHLPDRKTRPCEKRVLSVKRLLYKLLLSCRNTGSVIPFLLR